MNRNNKGQFLRGKKGRHESWCKCLKCDKKIGKSHWNWKGGKLALAGLLPRCWCGRKLSRMDARVCYLHPAAATKLKMSEARKGKYGDEKHPAWKGNKAGYRAIHQWVVRKLGKPKVCENCGKKNLTGRKIHWANKSRTYQRVKSDWIRLCSKCHGQYDTGSRGKGNRFES